MLIQTLNISTVQKLVHISCWDCLPNILLGLKQSFSWSLVFIIVTEMFIGANEGIGKIIFDFQQVFRILDLYAGIILIGIIGYLGNLFFSKIREKLVFWV